MIRIINQPKKETEIYKVACKCGCKFECEQSDLFEGAWGEYTVDCPICGEVNYIDEIHSVELNERNLKFPTHFFCYENGVNISNEEIQKWARNHIAEMKRDGDEFRVSGSGNATVITLDMDDDNEYVTIVAKDYWECVIPK